jgi:hypothetical protein
MLTLDHEMRYVCRRYPTASLVELAETIALRSYLRWGYVTDEIQALVAATKRRAQLAEAEAVKANFNPNQPRDEIGRWTDTGYWPPGSLSREDASPDGRDRPIRYVQNLPRNGGARIGPSQLEATPAQQARWAITNLQASTAINRVRRYDPGWSPQPSMSGSIEGEIARNEAIIRQAEQHLSAMRISPLASPSQRACLAPEGRLLGSQGTNRRIREVNEREMEFIVLNLANGARPVSRPEYNGVWYVRRDGTEFGVRISRNFGFTIDIPKNTREPLLDNSIKFHVIDGE